MADRNRNATIYHLNRSSSVTFRFLRHSVCMSTNSSPSVKRNPHIRVAYVMVKVAVPADRSAIYTNTYFDAGRVSVDNNRHGGAVVSADGGVDGGGGCPAHRLYITDLSGENRVYDLHREAISIQLITKGNDFVSFLLYLLRRPGGRQCTYTFVYFRFIITLFPGAPERGFMCRYIFPR